MRLLFFPILFLSQFSAFSQCSETPVLTNINGTCFGTTSLNVSNVVSPSKIIWYRNNTPFLTKDATFVSAGTIAGGNGQGAAANQLGYASSVFVDSTGNIYVADGSNNRVQKFLPGGGNGITVAGGNGAGSALNQLSSPSAVIVDKNGNIYISDAINNRIVKWAPGAMSGVVVAGGNGLGSSLNQLKYPGGFFLDKANNIYIADGNHRIVKWSPGATEGLLVAGGNGQGSAPNQLNFPNSVVVDTAGNIYVSDDNPRVQKWAPGAITGITVAGNGIQGGALNQLSAVHGVFIDRLGNLVISDAGNNRILRWVLGDSIGITIAGGNGSGNGINQLNYPFGVFIDSTCKIFICDRNNFRIQKWTPEISKVLGATNVPGPGVYSAKLITFSGCNYTTGNINIYPTGNPKAVVESNVYNDICSGDTVKFASFIITEGINPTFQWKKNNVNISGENTAFLVTSSIIDGDVFSCRVVCSNTNGCLTTDTITVISDAVTVGHTYSFTGNGNWEDATNWTGNKMPPDVLASCSKIIIDPAAGGECVLNKPQAISQGAAIEVKPGKKFRVIGKLAIGNGSADSIFYQNAADTTFFATGLKPATAAELAEIPYVERMGTTGIPQFARPAALPRQKLLPMPTPGDQSANNCATWVSDYGLFSYIYNTIEKNLKSDGTPDYEGDDKTFSPAFNYNLNNHGANDGITIAQALKYLKANGCCKKADMPNFSNYSSPPSPVALQNAAAYKSSNFGYQRFGTIDIELIKSILVSPGFPLPFSCYIDASFITCTGSKILTRLGKKVWCDYSYPVITTNPHAMLVCGYDDSINAFKVMGSGGTVRGDGGFYWIDYNFFKKIVRKKEFLFIPFDPEIYFVYTNRPSVTITNSAVTDITTETAKLNCTVTNNGNASITERGICYSRNINPTTASSLNTNFTIKDAVTTAGSFNIGLVGLNANTLYYYRAYAKTSQGIAYSLTDTFRTLLTNDTAGIFTDPRDGQQYPYKRIGTQVWMTKNLNYHGSDTSRCYNNAPSMCATYGRLYSWADANRVAPPGWHLPSIAEWSTLITFLGGEAVAGGKMKSTTGWNAPNVGATNSSGFAGLPGGIRFYDGTFSNIGDYGIWWSSTNYDLTNYAWYQDLRGNAAGTYSSGDYKSFGISVRCIRD